MIQVSVQLFHPESTLPQYATQHAAGMDIITPIDFTIQPGERKLVPTGLAMAIPEGYEAQVRPRSGLALKHGITVLNTPGTIDADYRGEVGIILIHHGEEPITFKKGERIAQFVFAKFETAELIQVEELSTTNRGEGGFGSTGV